MSPIRFGILMVPYQTLDVAGPVDLLSSCSRPYLEVMERESQVSKDTAAAGLDIEFYYVGGELKPVQHTGNLQTLPTTTCDACPPLDYLLIGALLLAQTGLLNGRNATVNHVLLPQARVLYPKVHWNDSQQWVTDGCFWTASGACAGMDMFAHWVMENCHPQVAKASLMILDYTPRDIHRQHLTIPTQ
ncbi:class I glutamine amidotransferase-like protein [Aspergillus leporis]|uniref:Class I glutamine amidotransferase-like protein n=1 Tax=Aspergillus leporis TaxID=41062 RepID=A0A5N5XB59_9EURO|nr:class I glutamine amidotransferase-like protein [Aspergillus leporis]